MVDYLHKKEAPEEIVAQIMDSLVGNTFINDREFARAWVRSRLVGRPKSKRVLIRELKLKGITKDIIEEVFQDQELGVDDLEIARQLALKKMKKYQGLDRNQLYQKLGGFLGRRGFDFSTIKKVIDEMLKA